MVDQPGGGTSRSYKIPGHTRKRRTTKPYARPSGVKQKSLLDSVKDYLTPSWTWLSGYFQKDEREDSSDSEEDNVDDDSPLTDQRSSVSSGGEGSYSPELPSSTVEDSRVIVDEDKASSFLSTRMTEKDTLSDENSRFSGEFPENNNDGEKQTCDKITERLSETIHRDRTAGAEVRSLQGRISESDTPSQSGLSYSTQQLKRKPLSSGLHSRIPTSSLFQSQGISAARSHGNSFLSSISTSRNTSYTFPAHTGVTSSVSTTTGNVDANSDNRRRPQPAATGTMTPQFSMSTFITPVSGLSTRRRTESPFYPGVVRYGGALCRTDNITSKRQRTSSPGTEVSQYRKKQQIRAKPLPSATQRGSTSNTVQRMIKALESISSPLKDVRRIPSPVTSPSASPLSFLPSKMRTRAPTSTVGPRNSPLQAKFRGGPPVSAVPITEIAKVVSAEGHRNQKSTSNNSSQPAEDRSVFAGLKDTVVKTSFSSGFTPKPLPTSLSPVEKTLWPKSSGKMRSAPRGHTHYSSKNTPNEEVVNPLPEIGCSVPLPVNTDKMSPLFSLDETKNSKKLQSYGIKHAEDQPIMDKIAEESQKNGFIFSAPIPKSNISVKEALSIADEEVSFTFSQPAPVTAVRHKASPLKKDLPTDSPSTSSTSNSLENTWSTLSGNIAKSPVKSSGAISTTCNSLAAKFAAAPGEWSCSVCLIRNKPADQNCVACGHKGPRNPSSQQTKSDLTVKTSKCINQDSDSSKPFGSSKETWQCDTCPVRNKAEDVKCIACTAAKPGTESSLGNGLQDKECTDLKIKFAPPPDTWQCSECMVRNSIGQNKCIACSSIRPGSTTSLEDLRTKFAAPSGSWKCETCMVINKASDLKCIACQSSKPGSESETNTGSSKPVFNFGLSANTGSSSTDTDGFKFGDNSGTTSGFKFGESGGKANTKTSGFSFGLDAEPTIPTLTFGSSTSTTNTDSTTDSVKTGFTFGVGTSNAQSTAATFTFGGAGAGNDKGTGFTFGGTASETKSSVDGGVKEDSPGVSAPLNIAQAAAVGSPKVSTKDEAASTGKQAPMNIAQAAAAGLLKVPTKNEITSEQVPKGQPALPLQSFVPAVAFASKTSNDSTSVVPPKAQTELSTVSPVPIATSKETASVTSGPVKTTVESSKTTPFAFGAGSTPGSTSTAAGKPSLNFGDASKAETTPFSFGTQSTTTTEKKDDKPTFTFGVTPSETKGSSGGVFKFVGTQQSSAATKTSLFPVSTSTEAKNESPAGFSFIGNASTSENKAKPAVFNFGNVNGPSTSAPAGRSPATSTGNALFTFSSAQPPNLDIDNQNSQGGEEMEADSNNNHDNGQAVFGDSAAGFNFAAQTSGNAGGIFGSGSSGTTGNTAGGFSFSNSAVPPTFQFGTPNSNNTPSGGFSFGANTPGSSSPFVFGAGSSNNTPANAGNPSAASGGFSFGSRPTDNSTPTLQFGQGAPTGSQPVMFNVGATQSNTNRVFKKAVRRQRR